LKYTLSKKDHFVLIYDNGRFKTNGKSGLARAHYFAAGFNGGTGDAYQCKCHYNVSPNRHGLLGPDVDPFLADIFDKIPMGTLVNHIINWNATI
jgi:hypothetical protein